MYWVDWLVVRDWQTARYGSDSDSSIILSRQRPVELDGSSYFSDGVKLQRVRQGEFSAVIPLDALKKVGS